MIMSKDKQNAGSLFASKCAPALRYEIEYPAKNAEKRGAFVFLCARERSLNARGRTQFAPTAFAVTSPVGRVAAEMA